MKLRIVLTIGLLLFLGTLSEAHEETKKLGMSAAGIQLFEIDCGSGFLKVQGDDSRQDIAVEAEIILKGKSEKKAREYMEKYLYLELEKKGDRAVLRSGFDTRFGPSSWQSRVINLTVLIPARLSLVIEDSSGEMQIRDVQGDLEIDDGSGNIKVDNQGGDVRIDDGSGGIEVNSVRGSVFIKDGSGPIRVGEINGNVKIDDGSGSITVRDVGGDFILLDDGSGGLSVSHVRGEVKKR